MIKQLEGLKKEYEKEFKKNNKFKFKYEMVILQIKNVIEYLESGWTIEELEEECTQLYNLRSSIKECKWFINQIKMQDNTEYRKMYKSLGL